MQAIEALHSSLQTDVFSNTDLSLIVLLRAVPQHLLGALMQRHVLSGVLDIPLSPKPGIKGCLPLHKLVTAVDSLPSLTGLKICSGSLRHADLRHIAAMLSGHAGTLQSVNLSNQLAVQDTDQSCIGMTFSRSEIDARVARVWQALVGCCKLTSLDLSSTRVHPAFGQCLCDSLPELQGLKHLNLSYACIRERDTAYRDDVLPAILSLTNLTCLCLSRGHLALVPLHGQGTDFEFLSLNLHKLKSLRYLDMTRQSISLGDACTLLAAVASMPSMHEFRAPMVVHKLVGDEPNRERHDVRVLMELCSDWLTKSRCSGASDTVALVSGPVQSNLSVLSLTTCYPHCVLLLLRFALSEMECRQDGRVDLATAGASQVRWKPIDALKLLEALDLSCVLFDSVREYVVDTSVLIEFVANLPSLQQLNLSQCRISCANFQALCSTLCDKEAESAIPGLTSLDWSRNEKLTGVAVRDLCGMTTLQRLIMQDCGVGEQVV